MFLAILLLSCAAWAQEEKDEREQDDPRARQQYLEELRGADTGIPPGARMRALREMDEMIREEGRRYWRSRGRLDVQPDESESGSASDSAAPVILSGAAYEGAIAEGSPSSGQWLFIGPRPTLGSINSSGRTTAIVVDPNDSTGNTAYIGGAQGGVWKTTDGGANWTPLTDAQASLATGSMAIDGSTNPSTVYVGTGEQGSAFDSYYGAGILKSSDGGTTWTQLGASAFAGPLSGCGSSGTVCGGAFIGGLSVKPGGGAQATILAAVSLPTNFLGGPGIYRSTDGGTNWTRVLAGTSTLGATAVQYATSQIAYAGLDQLGVYKSIDGGATWNPANGTTPNMISPAGRVELAVALSDATGNTVYASVGAASAGGSLSGLYKTTDGGATWTKLTINDYCTPQCWYDNVVAASPANANVVFVGGSAVPGHVSKSVDGGSTWTAATASIHVDHHAAAFSANGGVLYWGNDGGVYKTTDTGTGTPGASWQNLNTMLGITQFYSYFALHPTNIDITLGGTQDNGTQRYDGSLSLGSAWTNVACGDGAGNVIDQNNPSIVYANCQNIDIRKSTNGGVGGFTSADAGIPSGDPVLFIPPMVGDGNTAAQNFLYFGTNKVYQTRDGAASWQAISSDLGTANCTSNSSLGCISNMAVAPSDRSVMYVVTRHGLVWKGTNLTANAPNDCATTLTCFADVTGNLVPASRRINAVAVLPSDPNTVFVGHAGFGSTSQHISKSTTGGTTWTNITGNLPNTPVNDIVVDPDIADTIYVATDIGVFRTTDGGTTWATLANGLPRVAVYGLKLHRASRVLRAATHGRGFWDLSVPVNITGAGGIFNPTSLSFSSVPLNATSGAQNISFLNNGTAPTTVSNLSVSGDFALQSNGCTSPVNAGASCTIGITFTPSAAGQRSGSLTVTSNAVNSPATASLSGLGAPPNDNFANAIEVNSGNFTHTTNTLGATTEGADPTGSCDFSSPTRAKSVWYFYTPASSGSATINTRGSGYDTVLAVFTGTTGSFAEVLNGCNDDINNVPESPSEVIINVTGGTTYRALVSGFVPNDGGTLTFNVVGPTPVFLTAAPSSLGITAVVGRTSGTQAVTFTNGTGSSINVTNVAVTGPFGQSNNCGALANGASCTINVSFTPSNPGASTGTLTITSSGGARMVALNGTGLNFTLALSRPTRPLRGSSGSTIVLDPGQSQTVDAEVGVTGGAGEVVFSCASPTRAVRCAVEPARLVVKDGIQPVRVRLTAARASRLATNRTDVVTVTATILGATRSAEIPVQLRGVAEPSAPPRRSRRLQPRGPSRSAHVE